MRLYQARRTPAVRRPGRHGSAPRCTRKHQSREAANVRIRRQSALRAFEMLVGIVRVALQRPYTFAVLALLLLIIGPLAAMRTPTDIFPEIRIPVIAVAWQYTGLPPEQMAGRITTLYQRSLTTTVNDIEHIEDNSSAGIGIVKILSLIHI